MKKTYVIVGLGLIGGSLGAAIIRRIPQARVIGVSRNPKKIRFAKKQKLIHEGFTDIKRAVQEADLIFICTPVDTISNFISEIDKTAKPGAVVTDVGSTKFDMIKAVQRKSLKRIQFVGSHPLAGSHLTGVEAAIPNLFERAFVFVTPSKKSSSKAVYGVASFWRKLNTKVKIISPQLHDEIVSEISHLPHAAATALMHAVSPKAVSFSASGFLDTTRIAQGDPRLWTPIFLSNRKNVIKHLSLFGKKLARFSQLVKQGKAGGVRHFLEKASQKRSKLA